MKDNKKIAASDLKPFCIRILEKIGVPKRKAVILADSLVMASLRGVDTHGIAKLPIYVKKVRKGLIDVDSEMEVVKESASTLLIDGHNGIGQVIGSDTMNICIKKAKQQGMVIAGVRNSNHFGACAYYAMMPLEHNMIGFALSNAPATMAPWGAKKAYLGTNPFAVAVPTGIDTPFVIDMATSKVAQSNIIQAAEKNEKIPKDWAIDSQGNPTQDPEEALEGAILPMAEAKGYIISLLIDVLCGILTGASFGNHMPKLYWDFSEPQNTGHVFGAIKVDNFIPYKEFIKRMSQEIKELKNLPTADGFSEVYLPGEIERNQREKREKEGIPVGPGLLKRLKELSKDLCVEFSLGGN